MFAKVAFKWSEIKGESLNFWVVEKVAFSESSGIASVEKLDDKGLEKGRALKVGDDIVESFVFVVEVIKEEAERIVGLPLLSDLFVMRTAFGRKAKARLIDSKLIIRVRVRM